MVFNYRLYGVAALACSGALLFGYDTGFIGGNVQLKSFQEDFGMNAENSADIKGNIVATLQAGCFFGCLFMAFLTDRLGRKWGMFVTSAVFQIGAIMQIVSKNKIGLLYGGRIISGLGVGAASMLAPTYLAEIAPKDLRSRLTTMYAFSIFLGICIAYWVDYACEHGLEGSHQWLIPMALQLVPGGLLLIGSIVCKESPRWLLRKNRTEEAEKILAYYRNKKTDDPEFREEYEQMLDNSIKEAHATEGVNALELFKKNNWKRTFLGFTLMVAQQFTGTNVFTYYAPLLFTTVGITGSSASLFATGVYGIVKLVFSMIFMLFFSEKFGRRLPILIGGFLMGTWVLICGLILATNPPPENATSPSSASYAMIIMIYFFCVTYSMTWGPIPFTIVSEIFTDRTREYGVALGMAAQWAFNFVISRIVPLAIANIGWRTFLMFAIFNYAITTFCFFTIRETQGVPVERMTEVFEGRLFMKKKFWNLKRHPDVLSELDSYPDGRIITPVATADLDTKEEMAHIETTTTGSSINDVNRKA